MAWIGGAKISQVLLELDEAQTSITSILNTSLVVGRDADNDIDFTTDNNIRFRVGGEDQLTLVDGALTPTTNAIVDLGTDALEFKDGYFDGTLETDNLTIGGAQGSDGEVLTSTGSGVAWEAVPGGTPTSLGTITQDTVVFTSANADDPLIQIKNTTNDATGARLQFVKDKGGAGADGDDIGIIEFVGDDAAQTQTTFAKIVAEVSEADDTDEAGKLSFYVAESDGTTTALAAGLVLEGEHATDGEVDVTIANGAASLTTVAGDLTVTSKATIPTRKFTVTGTTHFETQGDIVYLGSGSTTAGELCYYTASNTWVAADADATGTAGGVLLALALGTDPDVDGMLLRGMFTLDHDPGTIADELYVSTTAGDITGTAPSGTGDIVRVIGYCMDSTNGQIWFNPSNDFIVLA